MRNDGLIARTRAAVLLSIAIALVATGVANADPAAPRRLEAGRLEVGDTQLPSGEYCDQYQIDGAAGTLVILELHSTEYDAFVQISPADTTGPHGDAVWHNNDSQVGTQDARLAVTLPVDGAYDVYVTSAAPDETGRYELSITVLNEPDRTENGQLTEDDRALNTGEYCDYYDFTAKRGELWVIDVVAPELDTYVFARAVDDPEFKVDNDDMLGETRHSQIVMSIPRDGEYFFGVTSSRPGDTGEYQVTLSATTSIAPPAEDDPPGLIEQGARGLGLAPQTTSISTQASPIRK